MAAYNSAFCKVVIHSGALRLHHCLPSLTTPIRNLPLTLLSAASVKKPHSAEGSSGNHGQGAKLCGLRAKATAVIRARRMPFLKSQQSFNFQQRPPATKGASPALGRTAHSGLPNSRAAILLLSLFWTMPKSRVAAR